MTFIGLCPTLAACDTEPTEPGTVAFGTPGGATGRLAATNGWTMKHSLSPWRHSMSAGTMTCEQCDNFVALRRLLDKPSPAL